MNLPTDHQLNRGNVERTVREELAGTSPKKNGRPPKIHDELVHACHLQTAMMQASGGAGEADKMSMTSTITALTEGTINEGIFLPDTVWRKLRKFLYITVLKSMKIAKTYHVYGVKFTSVINKSILEIFNLC